ncbi:sensor histidine kinase [Chitinophaga arvensicola]|uniref:Histidine kinase n=1 Tax=Chitinophaga arvensicola TaxID=29529 RepID=A0A1I0QDZ5_9BACT|nr:sensor histidine kinase [Chitinophaga arvensicola]SEW25290.1 Histidine kinase [Chitinophaga arvensicola]
MKNTSATFIATGDIIPGNRLLAALTSQNKALHLLFLAGFWICGFIAIVFYTGNPRGGDAQFWYFTVLHFLFFIYFGRYLCGKYLLTGKPIFFTLSFLLCWSIITIAHGTVFDLVYHIRYQGSRVLTMIAIAPVIFIGFCMGVFLKLLRHTLREQYATATQQKSELDLLLSQLSPHFLFNTLNNLYGLSLTKHERMPEMILKLSDLLRYSVYDAKQTFVPLTAELAYIDNYIELARTNIGSRLVLHTSIAPVTDTHIKIAPMLLIVFVENAFKHAVNTTAKNIYIDIRLSITNKRICFTVKNSFGEKEASMPGKNGGVGLANTLKRMELLYNNGYEYHTTITDGNYTATLTLNTPQ